MTGACTEQQVLQQQLAQVTSEREDWQKYLSLLQPSSQGCSSIRSNALAWPSVWGVLHWGANSESDLRSDEQVSAQLFHL